MRNGAIFISEDTDVVTMALTRIQQLIREFWHGPLEIAKPRPLAENERICAETGRVTTCWENCHPRGANCTNGVNTENIGGNMMEVLREAFTEEERPAIMRELAGLGQAIPDDFFNNIVQTGTTTLTLADIEKAFNMVREEGYFPTDIAVPMTTFRPEATGELEAGDLVVMDGEGNARRAVEGEQVVGIALGDGRIRMTGGGFFTSWAGGPGLEMSWAGDRMNLNASIANYGSMMWQPGGFPQPRFPRPARFQYNERFPKEVVDKAMALLEKFMSADQYQAFMEGSMIELQNKAEDHRIMLNRHGKFSILKGPRGEGIMMTSGNIGSMKYPIGDEIAVFLDWFRFRTRELIERWNCGTFTIKDYL